MKDLPAIDDLLLHRHLKEQDRSDAIDAERERVVAERLAKPVTADDVYEASCAMLGDTIFGNTVRQQMAEAINAKDVCQLGQLLLAAIEADRQYLADKWARDEIN